MATVNLKTKDLSSPVVGSMLQKISNWDKYDVKTIRHVNLFRKTFNAKLDDIQKDMDSLIKKHAENGDEIIAGRDSGQRVEMKYKTSQEAWQKDLKELLDSDMKIEIEQLQFEKVVQPLPVSPLELEAIEPFVKGLH